MRIISFIFILLLIIIGISFACLNADTVSFNYYIGERKIALSLLLMGSLLIGVVVSLLGSIGPFVRLQLENRRLSKRLNICEQEIANLRAIPIKDAH